MDTLHTERSYVSGGSRNHKSFVFDALRGRKTAALLAMVSGLEFLAAAKDAGLSLSSRVDFAGGLIDDLSNVAGQIAKDADNEHLSAVDIDLLRIDTTELEAAHAKLVNDWRESRRPSPMKGL